jgi:hypothetical protein
MEEKRSRRSKGSILQGCQSAFMKLFAKNGLAFFNVSENIQFSGLFWKNLSKTFMN